MYGSSAGGICGLCGSLCLPFDEVKKRVMLQEGRRVKFGRSDFKLALRYPLREWVTTLGLGALYGACLFSLSFFGIYGAAGALGTFGLFPAFIANAMMFGCSLSVINTLGSGRTDCRDVFDISSQLAEIGTVLVTGCSIFLAIGWPLVLGVMTGSGIATWLAVVWIVIYYPMSLLVAAGTGSFWATVNPGEALRAARGMGRIYWKLLLMYLIVILAAGACVAAVVFKVMSWGFSLPTFLTLGVVVGLPAFYANMVIACLIGRAVFKSTPDPYSP